LPFGNPRNITPKNSVVPFGELPVPLELCCRNQGTESLIVATTLASNIESRSSDRRFRQSLHRSSRDLFCPLQVGEVILRCFYGVLPESLQSLNR